MKRHKFRIGAALGVVAMLGACASPTPQTQAAAAVSGDEHAHHNGAHASPPATVADAVDAGGSREPAASPAPPTPSMAAHGPHDAGTMADGASDASGHDHHMQGQGGHDHAGHGRDGGSLPPGHLAEMQSVMRPLAHGASAPDLPARICAQARTLQSHAAAIEAGPVPEAMRARADAWRAGTARVSRAAAALATTCERGAGNRVTERLDALHAAFHDLTDGL